MLRRVRSSCLNLDARQQHQLGKPLDKGAFAAAHRADDAEIDVPAGALCNVLVDLILCHGCVPPLQRCGNQQTGGVRRKLLRRVTVGVQMVGGGQVTGAGMVAPGNVKDALPLPSVVNIEGRAVAVVVFLAQLHAAERVKALRLEQGTADLDL